MSSELLKELQGLLSQVAEVAATGTLDKTLQSSLNDRFPPDSEIFLAIKSTCLSGMQSGDLCQRQAASIRYGRAIAACDELARFSVDVVYMKDVVGPHHRHPCGEIDMIMPVANGAKFDGHGAGWLVYPPASAHSPTVSDGDALVLYMLPEGQIEFARRGDAVD